MSSKNEAIRWNAKGEIIVPIFRVGVPKLDLAQIVAVAEKVRAA